MDFDKLNIALIPGPKSIPQPFTSINVQEIAEYPTSLIVQCLRSLPFIRVADRDQEPETYWGWQAVYCSSGSEFTMVMSCLGEQDDIWGGLRFHGKGNVSDVLSVWDALKKSGYGAVWLHDGNCQMYTQESFSKVFGSPDLKVVQ